MTQVWAPPSVRQRDSILDSDARINIWHGSVRSGKTVASLVRWLNFLSTGPPGKKLIAGKTERTIKRNVLDVIADIVGERHFYYNRGLGEVTIGRHKCEIAAANDERSEGKIRGLTLAGAYGDEVSLWPESFFTMLLSRLSVRGAKFFGTTNPEGPYHWLKRDYIDREGKINLRTFHFTLDDNPALDPRFVEDIKREYTGVWYQRYIEGRWVLAEGIVYSMFDEDVHVVDEVPKLRERWVGVDYGTSNPTAFVLVGLGTDDCIYIVDEYYHEAGRDLAGSRTDAEYADDLEEWLDGITPRWIFIDPSAKSFRTQLYHERHRCPAFAQASMANNELLDGIRKVSSLLHRGRLFVHRRCENVIREFYSYSWNPTAQERGEDKPLEEMDHTMDAIRYVINSTGRVYDTVMAKGR